jgi:HEAT repeat protein
MKLGLAVIALGLWLAFTVGRTAAGEYEVCLDVTPDIRALGSDDLFESEPAADRLSALGPAAWPALLRALEREGPAVRDAVIGILAIATKPDDSVQQGVARVARNDPEPDVRAVAVPALRKLAGKQSYDGIVAALDDPSPAVRRKAITACTDLCTGDAALARLVALALTDEPVSNALQAKRVLWSLTSEGRNREIVAAIRAKTIATSSERDVSGQEPLERRTLLAALMLAEIGEDARLDDVARATRPDEPDSIRVHAVHALGRLGGADRVALLASLEQDPAVAIYVHDALRRMSERGVAGAKEAADGAAGPRAPTPLPRP